MVDCQIQTTWCITKNLLREIPNYYRIIIIYTCIRVKIRVLILTLNTLLNNCQYVVKTSTEHTYKQKHCIILQTVHKQTRYLILQNVYTQKRYIILQKVYTQKRYIILQKVYTQKHYIILQNVYKQTRYIILQNVYKQKRYIILQKVI